MSNGKFPGDVKKKGISVPDPLYEEIKRGKVIVGMVLHKPFLIQMAAKIRRIWRVQ